MLILQIAALASAAAAPAQARPDPNCSDDNGVDRCATQRQAQTRALFGLRSIEQHREAGDQVRRVFYVDGYGRDMIVIALVRTPGREPMAQIHFPRRERQRATPPLEAPVSHIVWGEMLRRSASFDRSYAPRAGNPQDVSICLHSWVYTIEANDPARANLAPGSLRRKTEDSCQRGPAAEFAWDLQRAALPLFPHCDRLDPDQHRNPAAQLAACAMLTGDRMAAAEVMNRLNAFRRARRTEDGLLLQGSFAQRAQIDWNGIRSDPGDLYKGNFWLARMASEGSPSFFVQSVEGLAADRVRVAAFLERSVDGAEGSPSTHMRAPIEMIWVFGPAQQFEVESATVGAWERYRPG